LPANQSAAGSTVNAAYTCVFSKGKMTILALYGDSLGRLVVGNISKAGNIKRIERCHAIDSKEYEAKYVNSTY